MDHKKVLKKYPNRRLYDTEQSAYVTLEDVAKMIKAGIQVEVIDLKTNQDVTAFILSQIIMERAKKNHALLPVSLLHLIIRFGEDVLNDFFEKYLEKIIDSYLYYKNNMEEQFTSYLEMGMDLSKRTEKNVKKMTPFHYFWDPAVSEKEENK
jgi:polyhydroxyalkanoate synthesis repressor PhaR